MNWQAWLYGLFAALIGGGATSLVSWLGMAGANAAGLEVHQLNGKDILVIFASGAITNVASYLKASPLPKVEQPDPPKTP